MLAFKLGCDPELFVQENGKPVSAHGLVPGTKKEPFKVDRGAVQVDGMALEFNTDPATSADEFSRNIQVVMDELKSMIPENLSFDISPVAFFEEDYIKAQPKEAVELGCEPDYNAWTGQPNNKPDEASAFRTASGHIHIGWTEGADIGNASHLEACCMMVKQLDCTLALVSLLWDHDHKRRELYGMLGSFRPKSYGVEYRVLSNAWIKDPILRSVVFGITKKAFDDLVDGRMAYEGRANYSQKGVNSYGKNKAMTYGIYADAKEILMIAYFDGYIYESEMYHVLDMGSRNIEEFVWE